MCPRAKLVLTANKVSLDSSFISLIPKYNNYNNYNNYHISHMHTPTKHLSTNAIIQSLYMISLFKAMPAVILQVLYKKRRN